MQKCKYLKQHGFIGHIKNVNYWYRKVYNLHRDKDLIKKITKEEVWAKQKMIITKK